MNTEFAFQKNHFQADTDIRLQVLDSFAIYWLTDRRSSCNVLAEVNALNWMKCNISFVSCKGQHRA